jgi:hypothetical protein
MTVKELIELLENENKEEDVYFSYNYGDHCNTTVAQEVSDVEKLTIVYSEYHRMHRLVDEDEDGERDRGVVAIVLK